MFLFCVFSFILLTSAHASNKLYIDAEDLDSSNGIFQIHLGHNHWIQTNNVCGDATGIYTHQENIITTTNGEIKKMWKCPYCYLYWPVGTPCQNPDCPSKY
jgi:hypothetical protein